MAKKIDDILQQMRRNLHGVRFSDICRVCDHYFKKPRQHASSHRIYEVKIEGRPPINIQSAKGMAKPYQVRQVLKAIQSQEGE